MPERLNPPLPTRSRRLARSLRRSQTDTEILLWRYLRASRLNGFKFRRQHSVPPYVLDFYCDSAKLAIELDGSQHSDDVDAERTTFLIRNRIRLLRFWDNEVFTKTEAVLEAILTALQDPTLTPTPLPMGEGLKKKSIEP